MRMGPRDSIKGAQELALLLEKRLGVIPEAAPRAPLVNSDAAPIFHWLGIEPPLEPVEEEGLVVSPIGRRRRLTSYLARPWA
jgi:hypothetical protein